MPGIGRRRATPIGSHQKSPNFKGWILGVLSAVVAALLVIWLTPLPGAIKARFWPTGAITFTVDRELGDCVTYVFEKPFQELSPPPPTDPGTDIAAWSNWALSQGAAEEYRSKVLVTVRSSSSRPVTVTGLTISVAGRRPALNGTSLSNGCGGPSYGRYAQIDLDKDPPRIVASTSVPREVGDDGWRTTPLQFPYVVTDIETETLLLYAETTQNVRWTATLSWTDGERSGTELIDHDGIPFETDAGTNAAHYLRMGGDWQKAPS